MESIHDFLFYYKNETLAQKKKHLACFTAERIQQQQIEKILTDIVQTRDTEKWTVVNGFLSELVNYGARSGAFYDIVNSSSLGLGPEDQRKFTEALEVYAKKRDFLFRGPRWVSSSWEGVAEYSWVGFIAATVSFCFVFLPAIILVSSTLLASVALVSSVASVLINTIGLASISNRVVKGMLCCYQVCESLPAQCNVEENKIYLRHSHENFYDYVYKIKRHTYDENTRRYKLENEKFVYGQLELSTPKETLSRQNHWLSLGLDNEVIVRSGYRTACNNVIAARATEAWLTYVAAASVAQFLLLLIAICLPIGNVLAGTLLVLGALSATGILISSLAGLRGANAEVNRYQLFFKKNYPTGTYAEVPRMQTLRKMT